MPHTGKGLSKANNGPIKADNGSSKAEKSLSRETDLPENHFMPLLPTTQTIIESSNESLFDKDFNDFATLKPETCIKDSFNVG